MQRVGGVILAVLLAVGVVVAIGLGTNWFGQTNQTVTVRGVIGSEKKPFFDDPRVAKILKDNGYVVSVDTAGSRQIATEALAKDTYDFAFPSSTPAADKIAADKKPIGRYKTFYSPMVVASFKPIAELLAANGVATATADGTYSFDMQAYLDLVDKQTRWTDLPGNTDGKVYKANREILITSTDVRKSNSAAMYMSIISYLANGGQIVNGASQEAAVLPVLKRIFLDQGYVQSSSEGPFEDYISQGIGKGPLVMAYESQFLAAEINKTVSDDMVLMYPSPTVLSQHTLLSLTDAGDGVGKLLTTNPELQKLMAEYGFRVPDRKVFSDVLTEKQVTVPPDVTDTVETPSFETIESLITALEKEYSAAGQAPVDPSAIGDSAGTSPLY
jgi:hypothetical protein